MRKSTCLTLSVFLLFILSSKNSFAQAAAVDSSSQQNALNNAVVLYNASIGNQSPFYNGTEYYYYDPTFKGNAYFLDVKAFTNGSVFYDGALYSGIPMLYDLNSDEVVVLLYNHFSKFSLIKERVKSFNLLDHHFIYIDADTVNISSGMKPGFYDELYNGRLQVLVKRSKSLQTSTGGTLGPETYFSPSTDFFLKKDKTYYKINSQRSFINVLKDKKKELQQYIRANQINFGGNTEEAMVTIATYYDHLTN